jgi:L-fuculose-phosphate aldolase
MQKTERGIEEQAREDIIRIGQLLFEKGWVASNDGNITIRLNGDRILATPTGMSKGMMHADDLIVLDRRGNKISGVRERTTEINMHLTIYDLRPDVRAVVHAHPPVSTGFATAGRPLNLALLPEVVISFGCVPIAEYGLPGTSELTAPMRPLIPKHNALLMANHGVVAYGEDVFQAYFRMETVEHSARIQFVAEMLGGPNVLPRKEVEKLVESRARYGIKAASSGQPECPIAAEDLGLDAEERFLVTRTELIGLVDEALRARGQA